MYPDFKELLSVFNDHRVRYLIVGGYAVSLHSQPRATKDLDILIQPEPANSQAVFAALGEFGAPLEGMSFQDFNEQGSIFRMGREPIAVDILTEIPGVDFAAAWERRVQSVVDATTGLKANFISRDDLLSAKLAVKRPQGIADVDAIRKAAETQSP